ncbi:MAG TPA: DUF2892 domain-containing protein [Thermoanaerobaculia bacterium]|nr:DUF2892 domain-containing protein [Thermoanaerobaculia bacterium]
MNIERLLRLIAGFFVLLSVALGYFLSPWFFLFTAFVGVNLFQSAFTNWCPMMTFLRKFGVKEGSAAATPSAPRAA